MGNGVGLGLGIFDIFSQLYGGHQDREAFDAFAAQLREQARRREEAVGARGDYLFGTGNREMFGSGVAFTPVPGDPAATDAAAAAAWEEAGGKPTIGALEQMERRMMPQWEQFVSEMAGESRGIAEGFADREERLLAELEGAGEQERKDIRRSFHDLETQFHQDALSRGMGGTSMMPSAKMGIRRELGGELGRLEERLRGERLGLGERLSGQTLGAQSADLGFRTTMGGGLLEKEQSFAQMPIDESRWQTSLLTGVMGEEQIPFPLPSPWHAAGTAAGNLGGNIMAGNAARDAAEAAQPSPWESALGMVNVGGVFTPEGFRYGAGFGM